MGARVMSDRAGRGDVQPRTWLRSGRTVRRALCVRRSWSSWMTQKPHIHSSGRRLCWLATAV